MSRGLEPFEFVPGAVETALGRDLVAGGLGQDIAAGRIAVQALKSTEQWFGVTHPRDIDVVRGNVRELIRQGRYPRSLDSR